MRLLDTRTLGDSLVYLTYELPAAQLQVVPRAPFGQIGSSEAVK